MFQIFIERSEWIGAARARMYFAQRAVVRARRRAPMFLAEKFFLFHSEPAHLKAVKKEQAVNK